MSDKKTTREHYLDEIFTLSFNSKRVQNVYIKLRGYFIFAKNKRIHLK